MIITTPKPIGELLRLLSPYSKVLVAGCNTCVTIGKAGGDENIRATILALEIGSAASGSPLQLDLVKSVRQCEAEMLESTVGLTNKSSEWDAVLSFGCAAGLQILAEFMPDIPVIPALNTRFIGSISGSEHWENRCIGCGDCFLHLTGGICVLARCPRSMQNGSCGFESEAGLCDVNPKRECVWNIIRERSDFCYIPARNWSLSAHGGVSRLPQRVGPDQNKS